jgi:hypothetical protein
MKTYKKPYQGKGKPAISSRSVAATHTFKKAYGVPELPKCRKCNDGRLRPTQWNRLLCSNMSCDYSELA